MEDITKVRKGILDEAGFLPSEVRVLSASSLSSPSMRSYIRERRQLRAEMKRRKMSRKAQTALIRFTYKAEGFYDSKSKKLLVIEHYQNFAARRDRVLTARLPRTVLVGMTTEQRQVYRGWIRADFLPFEAKELTIGSKGVKVNAYAVFNSIPGRLARANRKIWVRDLLDKGWSIADIKREINNYYASKTLPKPSPFDWIRKEYRPLAKKTMETYRTAVTKRRERRAARLYRKH